MLFLGHCLASPAGEFPSSPGVTELQEQAAGRRRRKECFLTGLSAESHQCPSAPKQGCTLSGAGLTLGTLTAGTPDDTKGGAFLGRLWNSVLLLF